MLSIGLPLKIQSSGYLKTDRLSFEGGSRKCQIVNSLGLRRRNRTLISAVALGTPLSLGFTVHQNIFFFFWFNLILQFSGRSQIKFFRFYPLGTCWINCRLHFVGVGISGWGATSALLKVADGGGSNNSIKTVDTHLPWGFEVGLNQIWIWHFTAHIKGFYKGTSEQCQLCYCSDLVPSPGELNRPCANLVDAFTAPLPCCTALRASAGHSFLPSVKKYLFSAYHAPRRWARVWDGCSGKQD